ncbi:hypothetical protein CJU90_4164 [Yarrowia sp. C11]|nr:hypothetical protein CKK34_6780 [Yarrowia sp. E02]KAG5365106.1 hypothetical protein CJU90_4164 [Yarrowia sp. C11]
MPPSTFSTPPTDTTWTSCFLSSDDYDDLGSSDEDNIRVPAIQHGKGNAYQYHRDLKFCLWDDHGSDKWNLKVLGSLVKAGLGPELDDPLKRLLWAEHPYKEVKGNKWSCKGAHKHTVNEFVALILFNSGTIGKATYLGRYVLCNSTLVVTEDDKSADIWMTQLKLNAKDLCLLRLPNPKVAKHRVDLFHVVVTTLKHINEECKENSQLWNCKYRRIIFDNHGGDKSFKKFAATHALISERQWCIL